MLPSIDTYLHNEISNKLKIIMENRYIIREILKGVQPEIAENFMSVYCGDNRREIPIVYTMPQDKQTQLGAIYIGLREGQETHPSISNLEETYEFKDSGYRKDKSIILATPEEDRCYLEVEEEIGEFLNVENLIFSADDGVKVEGNKVYFKYDPDLVGLGPFNVNYIGKVDDEEGYRFGFTTTEYYSILVLSTNMDTVRCLDLILKAVLILMRNNPSELSNATLQRIQFGQIEEIDTGRGVGRNPEILYGRETIVSYRVSYSLDSPLCSEILEDINVKLRQKESPLED